MDQRAAWDVQADSSEARFAPRVTQSRSGDIGGRLRVASILRNAGITDAETPVLIAGATNEVWRAGDYIVRVGYTPGSSRLRREFHLANLLPRETHCPKMYASGAESFGEWIIVRRLPGEPLSQMWGSMTDFERKSVVEDIALALRSVHSMKFDQETSNRIAFVEGQGDLALPHQLPASKLYEMLDRLSGNPFIDSGMIEEARQRTKAVEGAFAMFEGNGLVHGDLHFENILVKDGILIALLDFEWARIAPKEIDIDVLARFCSSPELHIGGSYTVNGADYKKVLHWFAEFYPELFGAENVRDKLMLCSLAFEIPSLFRFQPETLPSQLSKFHPVNRLRDLLLFGSHAERLGWD